MTVCLVVPTRNPGSLWPLWLQAVQSQQHVAQCMVVDSSSTDGTDFSALPRGWQLMRIAAADFNHGATRNLALQHLPAGTSVVVFMTQDALLADAHAVQKLVAALADPAVACAWGRQLPHAHASLVASPIAAHARAFNYPATSRVVSLADRVQWGLKTCFMSNSFAAYRVADLQEVRGFPSDVILGEDMAVAARLLMAGKRVAYVADACVYHSHDYTILEEFRRYFDIGVLHAQQPWLLERFGGATGEGKRFVVSELKYLGKNAPYLIPSALLRTFMKLLGYRLGLVYNLLPAAWVPRLSMHKGFWQKSQSV